MSKELTEIMDELFDDENINEWKLIGKLPTDLTDVAIAALSGEETSMPLGDSFKAPEPYAYVAAILQKKFFPDAPPLARGGMIEAMTGGPAPDWLVTGTIGMQLCTEAKNRGWEIEETVLAKTINDMLDEI